MGPLAPQSSRELRRERRERLGHELRRRRGLRSTGIQLLYLLGAVGLGLVVPEVPIGFTVSSDRAIEALLAVGIGIVTFIGVVYSLLFLVVQFGSTAFTPRLNLSATLRSCGTHSATSPGFWCSRSRRPSRSARRISR